ALTVFEYIVDLVISGQYINTNIIGSGFTRGKHDQFIFFTCRGLTYRRMCSRFEASDIFSRPPVLPVGKPRPMGFVVTDCESQPGGFIVSTTNTKSIIICRNIKISSDFTSPPMRIERGRTRTKIIRIIENQLVSFFTQQKIIAIDQKSSAFINKRPSQI